MGRKPVHNLRKAVQMVVTIRCPGWLAASAARREVRTLINDQSFWGHTNAHVKGPHDEIDSHNFKCSSIAVMPRVTTPQLKKVWIVEAEHFHLPPRLATVHATLHSAQIEALAKVNLLRDWVGLPPAKNRRKWAEALNEAREARAAEQGVTMEQLGNDPEIDGWIEIQEHELRY